MSEVVTMAEAAREARLREALQRVAACERALRVADEALHDALTSSGMSEAELEDTGALRRDWERMIEK